MLLTVRNKVSRDPDHNYSVMACDRCEQECPESKQPGQTGRKGRDAAYLASKSAPGWTEGSKLRVPRGRKRAVLTIELICPKCSTAAEAG